MERMELLIGEAPAGLVANWGWLVALGVGLIILGALAVWRARAATLVYVVFLGALFLVAAAAVLITAFSLTGAWAAFLVHCLWAAILAILGFILVTRPAIGAEAITLLIAAYFLVTGVFGIGFGLFSGADGAGLAIFEGLVSAALGALLLSGWPVTGLWAIGLFIGIDFILRGATIVSLGFGLRSFIR